MKNRLISILSIITIFIACENKVVQYPVTYKNDNFLKRSQEYGKLLLKEETNWLNQYIKNSPLVFSKTTSGFWISKNPEIKNEYANNGDAVEFEYEVTDINDELIYSYSDIGIQKAVLGKVNLPRGLHSALQLMKEGEKIKILLPSFLAYAGYGDQKKIGPNEPIIMDVHLIKIHKN